MKSRRMGFACTCATLLLVLGLTNLLAACGEANSTTQPGSSKLPASTASTGGQIASTTGPIPPPTGPVVGANGQITVIAPKATGDGLAGQFFWGSDNNIWQGGAGTPGVPPITTGSLGGKPLTKAGPLALSRGPALSPDGSRLVYAFSPEPEIKDGNMVIGQDIYLIDLKTGDNKPYILRSHPADFLDNPRWSADGNFIYFDSREPLSSASNSNATENLNIQRFEVATGKREKLSDDAREPVPLPSGKQIIFIGVEASNGSYDTELKLFDLETQQTRILFDRGKGLSNLYQPRPSPDGQQIVFSASGNAGAPVQPPPPTITPSAQINNSFPSSRLEAPTGGKLASPPNHGVPFDLWLLKIDGSDLTRLTILYEDQPSPAWSSDGKRIAFLAGQGFYLMDANGKNLVKKSDRGGHGGFDWRS